MIDDWAAEMLSEVYGRAWSPSDCNLIYRTRGSSIPGFGGCHIDDCYPAEEYKWADSYCLVHDSECPIRPRTKLIALIPFRPPQLPSTPDKRKASSHEEAPKRPRKPKRSEGEEEAAEATQPAGSGSAAPVVVESD